MKTPLTNLVAAIAVSALLSLPAYADSGIMTRPKGKSRSSDSAVQGKVLSKDIIVAPNSPSSPPTSKVLDRGVIVDPATKPAQSSRAREVKMASRPYVKQFTAKREGGAIMLSATVSLAANAPSETVNYEFMYLDNGRWNVVTTGAIGKVTIPSGGERQLLAQLSPTNKSVRLRVDVHSFDTGPYQYSSKSLTLKGREVSFVVRYGTNGDWVVAREYPNDLSNGFDAKEFARTKLNPLGLDTRIRTTKSNGIDTPFSNGSSIRSVLLVHTFSQLEMSFDDKDQAEQFRQKLISLVPDRRLTVESVREQ